MCIRDRSAPSEINRLAIPAPIPLLEPVMTATLFLRRSIVHFTHITLRSYFNEKTLF